MIRAALARRFGHAYVQRTCLLPRAYWLNARDIASAGTYPIGQNIPNESGRSGHSGEYCGIFESSTWCAPFLQHLANSENQLVYSFNCLDKATSITVPYARRGSYGLVSTRLIHWTAQVGRSHADGRCGLLPAEQRRNALGKSSRTHRIFSTNVVTD